MGSFYLFNAALIGHLLANLLFTHSFAQLGLCIVSGSTLIDIKY